MDTQNTNQSLFDINFSENVKTELKGAAVWAGIAAILALVSSLLGLVSAFMEKNNPVTVQYNAEGFSEPAMQPGTTGSLFTVVISLLVNILLFYFLNRFANQAKTGLAGNNQELVSNGLGSLSTYFLIIGVIIILILVIVFLAVAGLAIGAGS